MLSFSDGEWIDKATGLHYSEADGPSLYYYDHAWVVWCQSGTHIED